MNKMINKDNFFANTSNSSDKADYVIFKETKAVDETNNRYKVNSDNKNNFKAAIAIIFSYFLYAFTTIIHKYLYVYNFKVGPFFQLTYKYVGNSIVAFLIFKFSKVDYRPSLEFVKSNLKPVIIRCVSGSLGGMSYVIALVYVNGSALGVANCFVPIVTTIISSYILQDQGYNKRDLATLFICLFASFFIIDNVNATNSETTGTDLIMGFLLCFLFIFSNSIRNAYTKVLYQVDMMLQIFVIGLLTVVIMIISSPFISESLFIGEISYYILMLFLGAFEIVPLYLNIYALSMGDISVIAQFFYSYLPFVTILSYLFVGENITIAKALGITLIFSVSIYRSYLIYHESKDSIEGKVKEDVEIK